MVERHIRLVSTRETPTPAVVFYYVEKTLKESLCQTPCMNNVLPKN